MCCASVRRAVEDGQTTVTEFTVDDASAMRLQDWMRSDGVRSEAVVAKRPLDSELGSRVFLLHTKARRFSRQSTTLSNASRSTRTNYPQPS